MPFINFAAHLLILILPYEIGVSEFQCIERTIYSKAMNPKFPKIYLIIFSGFGLLSFQYLAQRNGRTSMHRGREVIARNILETFLVINLLALVKCPQEIKQVIFYHCATETASVKTTCLHLI